MELSKHKNHRNADYLSWLRKERCLISGRKAQCAHHIRLGTNGGSGLKPSDYFCIPLLNEYHSTGLFAIHGIGEATFFEMFSLNKGKLFVSYLRKFLLDKFKLDIEVSSTDDDKLIARMIGLVEELTPKSESALKKIRPKKSITENEFYQKSKELKRSKDKELRQNQKLSIKKANKDNFQSEYYEKAKELKRIQDKEYRATLKLSPKTKKISITKSEYYENAKKLKRTRDKEFRASLKLSQKTEKISATESEYYQNAKELKRIRDKEFRQKLKMQRQKTRALDKEAVTI